MKRFGNALLGLEIVAFAWTGLCAAAMLTQTRLLQGQTPKADALTGFVLCATWFAYNFVSPRRIRRWMGWLSGLAGCVLFQSLGSVEQGVICTTGLLWLCYYGLQRPGNAGLRAMPIAKPIVVAIAWTGLTVLLPTDIQHWPDAVWICLGRMAFLYALALAYDLHDLDYDQYHGLGTLAQRLGQEKTFRLIYTALACAALCAIANGVLAIYAPAKACALLLSLAFTAVWLRFLFQRPLWTAERKLLADGAMLVQCILVALASLLV